VFERLIYKYFVGRRDGETLQLVGVAHQADDEIDRKS
jgi:hypothetical protein